MDLERDPTSGPDPDPDPDPGDSSRPDDFEDEDDFDDDDVAQDDDVAYTPTNSRLVLSSDPAWQPDSGDVTGALALFAFRRLWKYYLTISAIIFFAAAHAHFWLRHPRITTHPALDWNARISAIPESDRAWPIYRQASLLRLSRRNDRDSLKGFRDVFPDGPRWPDAMGWLDRNADVLELYRLAAAKPQLACLVSDALDPEWSVAVGLPHRAPSADPSLIDAKVQVLEEIRNAADALRLDIRRAVHEADPARAAANIHAMLSIADHAGQTPSVVGDLTSASALICAGELTREACRSLTLNDTDLASLAEAFARRDRPIARPDFQRLMLSDATQRWFADGGWHGGTLTADGLRGMQRGLLSHGEPPPLSLFARIIAPYNAAQQAGRTKHTRALDHIMTEFEFDIAQRPWERGELRSQVAIDGCSVFKYQLTRVLTLNLSYSIRLGDWARAEVDAASIAIAVARHHRRTGLLPDRWDAMIPHELASVPRDPFDGQPARLLMLQEGPAIYFVGADGDDDSGRANPDPDAQVQTWLPPSRRASAPDGDWLIWPPALAHGAGGR